MGKSRDWFCQIPKLWVFPTHLFEPGTLPRFRPDPRTIFEFLTLILNIKQNWNHPRDPLFVLYLSVKMIYTQTLAITLNLAWPVTSSTHTSICLIINIHHSISCKNIPYSSTKLSLLTISFNSTYIVIYHNQSFGYGIQNPIWGSRPLQELRPPPLHSFLHLETIASGLKHFGAILSKLWCFEKCSVKPTLHKLSGLINSIQGKTSLCTYSWHSNEHISCWELVLILSTLSRYFAQSSQLETEIVQKQLNHQVCTSITLSTIRFKVNNSYVLILDITRNKFRVNTLF
jgi:hypothetical protein